ncbi:FAD-dependent oxidoreductase, partial [bacterium]|nr:FAD-dependent oxidoreductase [bacterium]
NTIKGAVVRDRLSDQTHSINARMTVNASGPWADFVSGLLSAEARKPLVRSQGIHMITNNITNGHGLVQYTESGRFFFIIPWRDKSLIGTTDTRYEGDPDKYGVLRKDVEHFLGEVRAVYPGAKDLTLDDISWTYGGLRPIVETETSVENVNKASRKYEFYDHEVDDGIKGMMSVIGGKYTTSRALAETLVDKVTEKMGLPRPARVTRGYVLPGGRIGSWQGLVERLERGYGLSSDDARRWGRPFGAFAEDLIAAGNENADLGRRPDERQIETLAVVQRAVTEEMAMTVEDMLFRRSGMGTTGEFSAEAVETVAKHMAGLLGWDDARLADEIQTNQEKLRRRNILDFDDPAPDPHGDASLLQVT